MIKYYTRACNFYYGSISKEKIKKKLSLPLNGNKLISFDSIEIITRKIGLSQKKQQWGFVMAIVFIQKIRNI